VRACRVAVDVRCLAGGEIRGFSRYTREVVSALARRGGLDVFGVTDSRDDPGVAIPVFRYAGGREIIREQVKLPHLLGKLRADVLLCPSNRGLPAISPCPSVATVHDVVEWDRSLVPPRPVKSALRFAYSNVTTLAAATRIITVSRHSADGIRRRLGIGSNRVRVVYEAAQDRFGEQCTEPTIDQVRRRYGIPPGSVLYVGGFDRKKDVATLVRAFARIEPSLAGALILAGKMSSETEALARLARSGGIGDRVRFPGFIEERDLPAFYRSGTCFVFPAVAEGFGLPVIEAMASGTPVVVAKAGSLPEVVGEGGQMFPAGDDAAAAKVIRELLGSPRSREEWATAGCRRAREFSWDRTAEQTEAVLLEAQAAGARSWTAAAGRAARGAHRWIR